VTLPRHIQAERPCLEYPDYILRCPDCAHISIRREYEFRDGHDCPGCGRHYEVRT
jgi:hypothetical protein